jgi:hypothetical protein
LRKFRVAFIICILVSLTMFGYNNGETVVKAESSDTMVEQEEPKSEQTTETEKSKTEKMGQQQKAETVNIEIVKQKVAIGLSDKQVKSILGPKYVQVTSALDGSNMWRYDVGAMKDYQFDNFMDEVDISALKGGTLNMQVFISWSDQGVVEHIAAYYVNGNDNLLHEYMKFPTGETKDNAIE